MTFGATMGGTWSRGKLTQTAGTLINVLVPPRKSKKTKVTKIVVTTGSTAHVMTCLRVLGKTTLTAAVAAGASPVLPLASDPGDYSSTSSTADNPIAASDLVAVQKPDGTYLVTTVASGTYAGGNVTLTAAAPTGGFALGAKVYFFGVIGDTDPHTGEAHQTLTLKASGVNQFTGDGGSVVESFGNDEPLLLQIDNGTVASVVEQISAVYGP